MLFPRLTRICRPVDTQIGRLRQLWMRGEECPAQAVVIPSSG